MPRTLSLPVVSMHLPPVVQQELKEWRSILNSHVLPRSEGLVSPYEFGAMGNNSADDTGPLQEALDKAILTKGTLVIPSATFKHTGLTGTARVRIVGCGPDSILRNVATDGSHGLHLSHASSTIDGWFIGNLTMAGEASSGDVLRLSCCHRGQMQNVIIPSAPGVGVRLDGSLLNTLTSVHVTTNHPYTAGTRATPSHGFVAQAGSGGACSGNGANANVFDGCTAEGVDTSPGIGFLLDSDGNQIKGGASEGNTIGVKLGAGVHNNIIWTYMEANTTGNIVLTDATLGKNIVLPAPGDSDGLAMFNILHCGDGSQAAPGWAYRDDPTLGAFRLGDGEMIFVYNDARILGLSDAGVELFDDFFPDATANNRSLGTASKAWQNIFLTGYWEGTETTDPTAPSANNGRMYFRDNGGKTELVVRFPTGAIQQIAIEP
jgi:hypothetical protein